MKSEIDEIDIDAAARLATLPVAATIIPWLEANLGGRALCGLTGTDIRAVRAVAQLMELYSYGHNVDLLPGLKAIVDLMRPHNRRLAYHAIAHVMDWSDRRPIWIAAGIEEIVNAGKCRFES